jgi:hypothetical protein
MPKPENIINKGFDKRPENINKKGRPRKLISHINTELKADGYCPASLDEIKEAYLTLIQVPMSEIKEIANTTNDNYPILYKLVAKELLGKRGMEMMERLLDRALGKPTNFNENKTEGNIIINWHEE